MASLLLSTGKYLHTAYAVSNIAEEFTNDDWSLSSQEGFGYIGQYIDDSAVDSSDPTDYVWTEFLDEDVDDLDDEGDMPMADFQSQIDALQDQIEVLQGDAENLQSSIEVNASNVADSAQLASEAADIANATGQYFWHDANGAHVSTEENNPEGERNSIWNSLGMLFRKGATNLLAVLAGGASGTDPKGIAIYDGQGNSESNIVAQFTDRGSVLGKQNNGQLALTDANITLTDQGNKTAFTVQNRTTTDQGTITDRVFTVFEGHYEGVFNHHLSYDYLGGLEVTFGYGNVYGIRPIAAKKNIALSNFGAWTIVDYTNNIHATGTIAFDSSTNTVTLTVEQTQHGTYDNFYLYFDVNYTSYIQAPLLTIGEIDPAYIYTNDRLLIGDTTGVHVKVTKAGKVTAQNIAGTMTEDYTGYYRMGGCIVLTGSVTINVTTANTNTDKPITFGHTFKYTPAISVSMLNIGGSYYQRVTAAGPSTTGFTARVRAGGTPGNVTVVWMAIGEEA